MDSKTKRPRGKPQKIPGHPGTVTKTFRGPPAVISKLEKAYEQIVEDAIREAKEAEPYGFSE